MKPLAALALSALLAASVALAREADLMLDKPSVVVLYTPQCQLTRAEQNEPGFPDFIEDFQTYQAALASALNGNRSVQYIAASAQRVRFKGVSRSVLREELGGFGIVVYVPGKLPAVFEGVATDHDVLCELHQRLPQSVVVQGCGA